MYAPRHKMIRNHKRALVTVLTAGALAGVAAITGVAPASAAPVDLAPAASVTASGGGGTVWDRLAQCESTGNFGNQDTGGNGHFGGFQFSPETWASVGGSGNPANASPGEQLTRAKILLAEAGPGQWECQVGLTRANGAAEGLSGVGGGSSTPAPAPAPAVAPQAQSVPAPDPAPVPQHHSAADDRADQLARDVAHSAPAPTHHQSADDRAQSLAEMAYNAAIG